MSLTSIVINDELRIPPEVVDLASFRAWAASESFPERGRISFLDGELEIDMSPENINTHSTVKGCLTIALGILADNDDSGQVFPDGTLIISKDGNLATEPDLTYVTFDALLTGRVRIGDRAGQEMSAIELVGSPDLVVEIVSPSSVRKDKVRLRECYFAAGVREYWLIDARKDTLSFEILIPGDAGYIPAQVAEDGFCFSPVWNRWFLLTRQPHATGLMRYRLEQRVD